MPHPRWILNDVTLSESDNVKYIGVNLSYTKPNTHVDNRIKSCRNAYYVLQGVGLCNKGMSADALVHIYGSLPYDLFLPMIYDRENTDTTD